MAASSHPPLSTIVTRWLFGTALVSWRYLWQITPLHRVEQRGRPGADAPPPLPEDLCDDRVQRAEHGVGSLFHRRFSVRIAGARRTANDVISDVAEHFGRFVPREVVNVRTSSSNGSANLGPGDEFVVQMPGPWDGPVRVVHLDRTRLRLATLRGHLEAGQVQFHAEPDGADIVFTVEAWARPSTRVVRLLYAHLRLAKEIQLNMWVRFCRAAATRAGGRMVDGVHIRTYCLSSRSARPTTADT